MACPPASKDARPRRRRPGVALGALLAAASPGAGAGPIGVVYPEVDAPYAQVFERIIEGVADAARQAPARRAVTRASTPSGVADWARARDLDLVITLGRGPLELVRSADLGRPLVAGAATFSPREVAGIDALSVTPDPALLFDYLTRLAPAAERVSVVHEPGEDGWIIERARAAAARNGVALDVRAARDLSASAVLHRDLLGASSGAGDAVWLLRNETLVDARTVLPLILERAWNRDRVVFSNNPSHVERGVLFALYPDHRAMGERLGRLARKRLRAPGQPATLHALRAVRIAVNLRTAAHLGLQFPPALRRSFGLVFPSR